jgi:hypothetical protein
MAAATATMPLRNRQSLYLRTPITTGPMKPPSGAIMLNSAIPPAAPAPRKNEGRKALINS